MYAYIKGEIVDTQRIMLFLNAMISAIILKFHSVWFRSCQALGLKSEFIHIPV